MSAVHFVVEQRGGREMPVCHPEGLPARSTADLWTHVPERVTCAECLAILAGDAGTVGTGPSGGDGP